MDYLTSSGFNPNRPEKMLLDINSCFATIEQQANPLLRGKEVVVAAYENNGGCILAASREAKKLGIKTGWRVGEAQDVCPNLIVLTPDVEKYRFINKALKKILLKFSPEVQAKSIDEFAIDFEGIEGDLKDIGLKIKAKIKEVLGEWITVSIGIGPNIFLAKVASNLKKPDGLVKINKDKTDGAIKFLQTKLKNQRVFMRFDTLKYDQENNLLCYLYLKNKTFINAHLIKNQLVDVDSGFDYKYKIKFLNLTK